MRIFLYLLAVSIFPVMAEEDISAKSWLQKMSMALQQKQFKVSLIQSEAGFVQPMVYFHGRVGEQEVAFLEHLNGAQQNVVRVGNTVTFRDFDGTDFSILSSRIHGLWPQAFSEDIEQLESSYRFILGGRSRIGGRIGQMIRLTPLDNDRYAYQIWLDTKTYLPIRYDMLTEEQQLLEQLQVIELVEHQQTPEILLKMASQSWPDVMKQTQLQPTLAQPWTFVWLPKGFSIIGAEQNHTVNISHEKVSYIGLSDGLVNVSVYVSTTDEIPLPDALEVRNGLAFATAEFAENQVIVVGKMPAETLSKIASSLRKQQP